MTTHGLAPTKGLIQNALEQIATAMDPDERAKIQPIVLGREDFLAAGKRDPEVHEAYLALRRAQDRRYETWLEEQRRWDGVGDTVPAEFHRTSLVDLYDQAEKEVAERRAFQQSPHGRILAACAKIEELDMGQAVNALVWEIRAACSRDFDGSADYIAVRFSQIVSAAKDLSMPAQNALLALAAQQGVPQR